MLSGQKILGMHCGYLASLLAFGVENKVLFIGGLPDFWSVQEGVEDFAFEDPDLGLGAETSR